MMQYVVRSIQTFEGVISHGPCSYFTSHVRNMYCFTFFSSIPRKKALSNPLAWEIDEYVQVGNFLDGMQRCDLAASVIIRYHERMGKNLKVIDDVHALIVTSTEPSLEIEVDMNSMRKRGPVYVLVLSERLPFQRTEVLKVAGLDALLTVSDGVVGSKIRMRYKVNRIRARWALNDSKKTCALLHAMIAESMRYMQEEHESD